MGNFPADGIPWVVDNEEWWVGVRGGVGDDDSGGIGGIGGFVFIIEMMMMMMITTMIMIYRM